MQYTIKAHFGNKKAFYLLAEQEAPARSIAKTQMLWVYKPGQATTFSDGKLAQRWLRFLLRHTNVREIALVKSAWKSIRSYPKVKSINTGKIVADDSHDEAWTGI
jgi:hypothetical protein